MNPFSIYLCGVGGQGTALLSDVIGCAVVDAGLSALVSDTHGIAQRGGLVTSHVRIGEGIKSPMIAPHQADVVIALERLEALRGTRGMLAHDGLLVYCDAVFQPASVRTADAPYPTVRDVAAAAVEKHARVERIPVDGIADPKMYNTLLLARLIEIGVVPGLTQERIITAIAHALPNEAFQRNKELFLSVLSR